MRTKDFAPRALLILLICSWAFAVHADQSKKPKNDPLDDEPGVFSIGSIVGGLAKAAESAARFKEQADDASREIEAARKAFWSQYPNGARRAPAEAEFARQLHAKDLYFLGMERIDGRCRGGALPKQQEGWGNLMKALGGELDGGLADGTASEFCKWANAARGKDLNAAMALPEYQSYKLGRDWAEFVRAGKITFDSWVDFYESKDPKWYVLGLVWGHNEYGIKRDKYVEGSFPEIYQRTRDTFDVLAKTYGREKVLGIARRLMEAPKKPRNPANTLSMDTGFLRLADPKAMGCASLYGYVDECFFELLLPRAEPQPVATPEPVTHAGRGVTRSAAPPPPPEATKPPEPMTPLGPCSETLRSGLPTGQVAAAEFVNTSNQPRKLFAIDSTGNRQLQGAVMPGLTFRWRTFVTQVWQLTDLQNVCIGTVVITKDTKRVEVR